jgi:hypothetical protein
MTYASGIVSAVFFSHESVKDRNPGTLTSVSILRFGLLILSGPVPEYSAGLGFKLLLVNFLCCFVDVDDGMRQSRQKVSLAKVRRSPRGCS